MRPAFPDDGRSLLLLAGIGADRPSTGRHAIEILDGTKVDAARQELADSLAEVRDLFGSLTGRVAEAVEILREFEHDDEARQAALAVLTGTNL